MLLTSGHVSVLLTSSIIVLFTALLFLSGYVLQQRTVASLQTAIKPRIQPPKIEPDPLKGLVGGKPAHDIYSFSGDALQSVQTRFSRVQNVVFPWSKLAYVQPVREQSELCNSIMFFSDLQKLKSPARRILMFPRDWLLPTTVGDDQNSAIETTKRLLRLAAKQYGVKLHPIEPLDHEGDKGNPSEPDYLARLFSLTDYTRILYLPSPGLLLDSRPFDSLLGYGPEQTLTATETNSLPRKLSTSMMLIRPEKKTYQRLLKMRSSGRLFGAELLQQHFTFPDYLSPEGQYFPVQALADTASIAEGLEDNDSFNETEFLERKAYITFSDRGLPGPQYDIPHHLRIQAMPSNDEVKLLWKRFYEMFRQKRMEICRLDLETWSVDEVGVRSR